MPSDKIEWGPNQTTVNRFISRLIYLHVNNVNILRTVYNYRPTHYLAALSLSRDSGVIQVQ